MDNAGIRTVIRVRAGVGQYAEFVCEQIGTLDLSAQRDRQTVAELFDAQRDAHALRYDPEHALQFDGYERLGPAAVDGEVGFTLGPETVIVHRITDAELLGGRTWTPTTEENEVLDRWTSTAAGRIDFAHKCVEHGGASLAVFWCHTYD